MDVRIGDKRVIAIHKGDKPIPGVAINNSTWPGALGHITDSEGNLLHKVYYNKEFFIPNYAYVYVSSGGKLYSPIVRDNCNIIVSSGGFIDSASVYNNGIIILNSGASAYSLMLNIDAVAYCWSGAFIDKAYLTTSIFNYNGHRGGYLLVEGTVASVTIEDTGNLTLRNNGVAEYTDIKEGGDLYLLDAGTASTTWVSSGGHVTILGGGIANDTVVSYGGKMTLSFGAFVSNIIVLSSGRIFVHLGAVISNLTSNNGAIIEYA